MGQSKVFSIPPQMRSAVESRDGCDFQLFFEKTK